jgi:hypothetical protein
MAPITLDPAEYWKLRTASAELERDQAAQAAVAARLETSRARRQALWAELAAKYALDPAVTYSARDEDCSLTPASNGGPPGGG